jgi:cytochrome c-type biogenesis protein CcmH
VSRLRGVHPSLVRLSQSVGVCLLAIFMLGAGDTTYRFNRLGHELVCVCGDHEILLECPHIGCPDAPRMIAELHTQLASGASDASIMNWFAAKYGPTVLAAPIRGGFDTVAWIMPYAVFFVAIVGTGFLIHYWKRRQAAPLAAAPVIPGSDSVRDRIRRDTEDL